MTPAHAALVEEVRDALAKAIPGYAGYEADEDGNIWSVASNWRGYGRRQLNQQPDPDGYLKVRLSRAGRRVRKAVHHLVCRAFHGEPSPGLEVRHLDGTRRNNRPDNLCWGTRSENAFDRNRHGTQKAAENGRKSAHKLTRAYRAALCDALEGKE